MNSLEKAKELVRKYPVGTELKKLGDKQFTFYNGSSTQYVNASHIKTDDEYFSQGLTREILADSLNWHINLTEVSASSEKAIPLGVSKIKGCPHLPKNMKWPKGLYFAAQLNCAEVNKHDASGFFPDSGMLYFFFDDASADWQILYHDGPIENLELRPYPDPSELPNSEYYYEEFSQYHAKLRMKAEFVFHIDDGLEAKYLPQELLSSLKNLLRAEFSGSGSHFSIFGRPTYWQGEDERGDLMIDMAAEDLIMQMEEGEITEKEFEAAMQELQEGESTDKLIFQDEFEEGHIHFWVKTDAFEKKDFSKSRLTFSGT